MDKEPRCPVDPDAKPERANRGTERARRLKSWGSFILPSLAVIACGGIDSVHPRWAVGVWVGIDTFSLADNSGAQAVTIDTLTLAGDGSGQQRRFNLTIRGGRWLTAARRAIAAGKSRAAVEAAVRERTGLSLRQLEDSAAPVPSTTAGSFRWSVTVDTGTNTAQLCAALDGYVGRHCGKANYEADTLRVFWEEGNQRIVYHRVRP